MRRLAVFVVVTLVVGYGTSNSPANDNQPGSDKAEAQFKGKPTSFWAKQLRDKNVASRIEAAKALEAIGPAAKSASAELKLALKECAWEVLVSAKRDPYANSTSTTVSGSIGSSPPKELTQDETIAKLRRELAQKDKRIADLDAQHEKQLKSIFGDPCLQALVKAAVVVLDRDDFEALAPGLLIVTTTTTFKHVGTTIGK